MPPQTDETLSVNEKILIDQSLSDYTQKVARIEKYLLLLLFIQWFVCAIFLGFGLYSVLSVEDSIKIATNIESLIPIIVLFCFYTFGLIVAYKQNRIGLLIFATVGVIVFIAIWVLFGYVILIFTALSIAFGATRQADIIIVVLGIVFAIMLFIMVMSLKFSFQLAKLINTKTDSTV